MITTSEYDRGLQDGLRVAIDLCRARGNRRRSSRFTPGVVGQSNPQEYQDRLAEELRKTLGLGFGDVTEGPDDA